MIGTNVWMQLLTSVLLTAATAFPQSSDRLPVTDAEKIASAMQAGPKFVTQNATVLDWPSRLAASSAFSGLARMGGPVFRVVLELPMRSPVASTRSFCGS